MKKAVEISLSTVIVAAIAILVLIVLIIIFTNNSGKFNIGLNDCGQKGGNSYDCKSTAADCVGAGGTPSGKCVFYQNGQKIEDRQDQVCCVFSRSQ
jgi:hypothetical protein